MVAMGAEDTEEVVEATAEEVEEVSVAEGVEAVVAAVATEDRAGKRSVTYVCILLCGFSEASWRLKLLWDHPSLVIYGLRDRSAFDSSAIYPINKGTRFTQSNRLISSQLCESSFLSAILFPPATATYTFQATMLTRELTSRFGIPSRHCPNHQGQN